MMLKIKTILLLLILGLLLISHLPFLKSDPDKNCDLNTRGAWTDEGLYAAQSRNFINTGVLSLTENSTFIRGPLQTLVYIPLLFCFGEHLMVLRLFSLIIILLSFLLIGLRGRDVTFAGIAAILVLLQFHVFHFSHYAMAEIICTAMALAAMVYFALYYESRKISHALVASFFVFLSYGFKIQYAYFAALLPLSAFVVSIKDVFKAASRKQAIRDILLFSGFSLAFAGLYLLLWYMPNKDFYNYVMSRETGERIVFRLQNIFHIVITTYRLHINLPESHILRYSLLAALLLLPFVFRYLCPQRRLYLVFLLVWLLLESHKLFMPHYLPVRYMLSAMIASGLLVSLIIAASLKNTYLKYAAIVIMLINIGINLHFYQRSVQNRSFEIKAANDYMKNYNLKNTCLVGSWAASISWGTGAKTLPLWKGFLQWEDPINRFNPVLVISETDEEESDAAYSSQGIQLWEESDSVRFFNLWRYETGVYWIKKE